MKNKTTIFGVTICLVMLLTMVSASTHSESHSIISSGNPGDFEGEMAMFLAGELIDMEFNIINDSCFKQASKEDQEMVKKLMEDSEKLYEKHQKEYDALDIENEKIFDKLENIEDEEAWEKVFEEIDAKYLALDKKTGMNKINVKLDKLYEKNKCDEIYETEFDKFDFENGADFGLTKEQIEKSEAIEKQIDKAYEENKDAYEKLDKQMEELEKEYQKLDEKTGIAGLYKKLENLWNNLWN